MYRFLKKYIGPFPAQLVMIVWYVLLMMLVFYCWSAEMAQFRYLNW